MPARELERLFECFQKHSDLDALAEVFDRTAPKLLKVARHLARNEATAEDLVQATFLAAIESAQRFDATRDLEAWLTGILTHKAQLARARAQATIDWAQIRDDRPEGVREIPASDPSLDAELREFVATLESALQRVPHAYRQVLRAHLAEEKQPEEIARDLDRPASTVRVQLQRGLKHLRRLLPAEFALPAAFEASRPRGLSGIRTSVLKHAAHLAPVAATGSATSFILGGVIVSKKIALIAALVVAGLGLVWFERPHEAALELDTATASTTTDAPRSEPASELAVDAPSSPRVAIAADAISTVAVDEPYGSLDIDVVWSDETPAADVGIHVIPEEEDHPYASIVHGKTDAEGRFQVQRIHEGKVGFWFDRNDSVPSESLVLRGRLNHVHLQIPRGVDVRGLVVDPSGRPVAGATIYIARYNDLLDGGKPITTSSDEGSFVLHSVEIGRSLFASAAGFSASPSVKVKSLLESGPDTRTVELTLRGDGSTLRGIVYDPDGNTVAGAQIKVFPKHRIDDRMDDHWRPILAESDAGGRFEIAGLRSGLAEVLAFSARWPVWTKFEKLERDRTADIEVRFERGISVTGTARRKDGSVLARAIVAKESVGLEDDLEFIYTRADEHGVYRLDALSPVGVTLVAQAKIDGVALQRSIQVKGRPGELLTWDPVFDAALRIAGRIEDERGEPLPGWSVEGHPLTKGDPYPQHAKTDDRGHFEIRDCVAGAHEVIVRAPGESSHASARVSSVTPGEMEIVVRVLDEDRSSAFVIGRLLAPNGQPLAGATMHAGQGAYRESFSAQTQADGAFRIGPIAPGTYALKFELEGYPFTRFDPFEVTANEEHDVGTITLPSTGRFEMHVRRSDGAALVQPLLMIIDDHEEGHLLHPDQEGSTFTSDPVFPGRYRLYAHISNAAVGTREVVIASGETTRLDLVLSPGSPRQVTLPSPKSDNPPKKLHIVVRDANGTTCAEQKSPPLPAGEDGDLSFALASTFAVGHYTFEAGSEEGWGASGAFEVRVADGTWELVEATLVRKQ